MWEDIKTILAARRNGEATHISYDHLAERLLADAEALLEFAGPDLAGRSFGELLRQASKTFFENGGGPLADCLAEKWVVYEELPAYLRQGEGP